MLGLVILHIQIIARVVQQLISLSLTISWILVNRSPTK